MRMLDNSTAKDEGTKNRIQNWITAGIIFITTFISCCLYYSKSSDIEGQVNNIRVDIATIKVQVQDNKILLEQIDNLRNFMQEQKVEIKELQTKLKMGK
jgi:hypothetical protein